MAACGPCGGVGGWEGSLLSFQPQGTGRGVKQARMRGHHIMCVKPVLGRPVCKLGCNRGGVCGGLNSQVMHRAMAAMLGSAVTLTVLAAQHRVPNLAKTVGGARPRSALNLRLRHPLSPLSSPRPPCPRFTQE